MFVAQSNVQCNAQTIKNSSNYAVTPRFTKRVRGLERFIRKSYLRETYLVLQTWMNEKTRTCWPGVEEVAERSGVHRDTIRKHLRSLEGLGVIVTTMRRKSCHSNLTSVYFFPLLNEDFLLQRARGASPQNAGVKQIPEIKEQTTTARETRAAGSRTWKPDRETLQPRPAGRLTHAQMWRMKCEAERERRSMMASLGTYHGEKIEMSDEEVQQIRARIAENERKTREQRSAQFTGRHHR